MQLEYSKEMLLAKLNEHDVPYIKTLNKYELEKCLPCFRGIVFGHEFEHMTTCFVERLKTESAQDKVLTGPALIEQHIQYVCRLILWLLTHVNSVLEIVGACSGCHIEYEDFVMIFSQSMCIK